MTYYGRGTGNDECGPAYLLFFDDVCDVNCGSNAAIDDLPSGGDFTVDGWVNASSYGGGNNGRILDKSSWFIMISNTLGLYAFADYDVTDAVSSSGLDDFSADGLWHHIAAVWNNAAKTWSLYVDGTEVTYGSQTAGANNYQTDAADDLVIGNEITNTENWDGLIGWLRISDVERWTANFTAPARCTLPAVDGDTVLLEIYEGNGTTTYNLGADHSHGTITDALWGCDCTIANDPTCENEVYVANKSNYANITDVYWYDASTAAFSANLQALNLPQILLPPIPAQNDIVYFGIDTTVANSGPFCSLVFDIGTAQVDLNTCTWQYWNGAWVALTVQDNTDAAGAMTGEAFDTTGVNSVHWDQPTDWVATAINGVTGYWVRVLLNAAVGANPAPPYQQNRHIYTVTWPHIEVANTELGGDLPVALKINFENPSVGETVGTRTITRLLVSSRNVARGSDFTPYLNLSDEQNPTGITVTAGVTGAFVNYLPSPTGRVIQETPIGALSTAVTVSITDTISDQYVGRFRVFVRAVTSVALNLGDYSMQVSMNLGDNTVWTSEILDNEAVSILHFDFGQVNIPADYGNEVFNNVNFAIAGIDNVAGAWTIYLTDLILMPVDEWAGDFFVVNTPGLGASVGEINYNRKLEIDSITNQKRSIQALSKYVADDNILSVYTPISNGKVSLGINSTSRIYFHTARRTNAGGSPVWASAYSQVGKIQIWKVQHYLSMRGDR